MKESGTYIDRRTSTAHDGEEFPHNKGSQPPAPITNEEKYRETYGI